MDSMTRYSAGWVLNDTALETFIFSFIATWLSPFWSSMEGKGDQAFNHSEFLAVTDWL